MAHTPDAALELLQKAYQRGHLAHAYLVVGMDAEARQTFALAFSRQLNQTSAATAETLATHGIHLVEPQSKSRRIRIDELRELEHAIHQRARAGCHKIGIIAEADRMTAEATNAFLKTLEEPPPHSLLFLLTGAPSLLLDTVLSRCIRLTLAQPETAAARLGSESEEQLAAALAAHFSKPPTPSRALGLVRAYTSILSGQKDQLASECAAAQKSEAARYDKKTDAGAWMKQREEHFEALAQARYLEFRKRALELAILWLGDLIRRSSGHPRLAFPQYATVIEQAAARLPVDDWLRRLGCLEDLQRSYETNVNEALATELAFLGAMG